MNAKKTNWIFVTIILLDVLLVFAMSKAPEDFSFGAIPALLISQAMLFVPAVLFLLFTKTKPTELIAVAKPKWSTSLLVILLTFLLSPLISAVNALSMLFVDNEVTNMSGMLQEAPAFLVVLIVGMVGPFSEEFVFRGVIYHGYRRSGRLVASMLLSAVLFGLMHLNFNQMSYAVVVGVIGVLLIEGTGNFFYSFLYHATVNTANVCMLLMQSGEAMDMAQSKQMIEDMMKMPYGQAMSVVASVYLVIACVSTAIAGCLYYYILKREGREEHIRLMFSKQEHLTVVEKNRRIWSWPLVVAILYCITFMVLDVIMIK